MSKFLLDTHTLIWFAQGSPNLSLKAKDSILEISNACFVSSISIWEIAIKTNIGKLDFSFSFHELELLLAENKIKIISPTIEDFTTYQKLPLHHKDPFDRILIAQAITNDLSIITKDREFTQYEVPIIW